MNKKFTKLMAALALLTFLAVPMGMRGQTTVTWPGTSALPGTATAVANDQNVTIKTSSTNTYTNPIRIYASTTVTINALNGAKILSVAYEASSTGNYVTYAQNATVTPNVTPTVSDKIVTWTYAESDNVTEFTFMPSSQTRSNGISITYKTSGGTGPTTYAVTFDAGDGTFVGNTDFPNASNTVAAGSYTLPSATPATGYTFDGWVATGITTPITGSYTVSGAVAFTAHYTQSGSSGQIATLTATNLDLETSYPSSEQTVTIDGITYAYHYLMKSSTNIQAQATNGVIRNTTAYSEDIVSVAITHSSTARATTIWGSANGENWTSVATGSGSITADFSGKGYKYFKITRGSNAAYWTQIVITCEAASSVAKPTFNPAGGIYTSAQSVTISAESGVNIYYTTDGSQPTTNSTLYNGAISIESTITLKAIAVVNGESSNVASATYTIVDNALTTMQAVYEDAVANPASHQVYIDFNNWVITGNNGGSTPTQAFFTDGTSYGCIIVNSNGHGFVAGNTLNGVVSCNLKMYTATGYSYAQLENLTTTSEGLTVGTGGSVTPIVTTIDQLSSANTGTVVTLNNLTYNGTYLADADDNRILTSNTIYAASLTSGNMYNITGVFTLGYTSNNINKRINPRSAADVVECPKATLTKGEISHVLESFVFVNGSNDPITFTNNSAQVYVGAKVRISIEMEENYFVESLTVTDGNNQSVEVTELTPGVYYSFTMPSTGASIAVTAREAAKYALTFGEHSHVTFTITDEESVVISDLTQIYEGTTVNVETTVEAGYYLQSLNVTYGDNQTAEITTNAPNHYSFTMPSGNAVLSATVVVNPFATVTLSSSNMQNMTNAGTGYGTLKTITVDGYYWETNGYQTGNQKDMIQLNSGYYINLPSFNGKIETISFSVTDASSSSYSNGSVYKGTLNFNSNVTSGGNTSSGTKTITLDVSSGFYSTGTITCASKAVRIWNIDVTYRLYQDMTGNTLETVGDDVTVSIPANANVTAENLTIPASSGIVINSGATLNISGNLTNNGNANNIIVKDGGQLKFYATGAKDGGVQATVEKDITGYGNVNTVKTGWNFIASPINVNNLAPTNVTNMLSNTYDLYQLNNTKWENYKEHEGNQNPDFNLTNGRGYLYANSNNVTLSFAGLIKQFSTTNNANQVALASGWNLVGNPYTFNVYSSKSYYTITTVDDVNVITAVTSANAAIAPCTGIVVKNTGTETDHVAFLESAISWATGSKGNIEMTLKQQATDRGNASTIDNAIVSFNEGSELEKFYFGNQNANLYIPQGSEEYAIVSSEAQGEMPVSFRANENGQYTLTVNAEGVEMGYLHLIDNMTGADIDLLANPSYSFNAKTTDYESRFRLVFAANNEDGASTGSGTFAFFSNGSWIINNEGEAILQVIDLNGRILSSETINGSVSKTINATTGIYMMRLINGDNVKTQKVVVR